MNRIKALLDSKGVLQKEFAVDIGVSQPTVSDWIHNKKDPRGENLRKVAEYFGVSPEEIKETTAQDSNPSTPNDIQIQASNGLYVTMPKTTEARILSAGIDRMPAKDRERALNMVRLMFDQYAEYFDEEGKDDDDS